MAVKDVPRYKLRLKYLLFLEEFKEKYDECKSDTEMLNRNSRLLKDDKNFLLFLKTVLDIGNHMNSVNNL